MTLVSLGAVSACASDQTHLPALLADPMADYEAEGIALIDAFEQAERPGFLGGKPTHAQVERLYRIGDPDRVEMVVADAVAFAEVNGWRIREPDLGTRLFRGSKEVDVGSARLSISFGPDDRSDLGGAWHLRIFLDFGPVRFDETTTSSIWRGIGVTEEMTMRPGLSIDSASSFKLGVFAVLVAVLAGMGSGTAVAQEDDGDVDVVLLGDSYSAGNGAGDYRPDDPCHRSFSNWAELFLEKLRDDGYDIPILVNEACSGAVTGEVWGEGAQDDVVSGETDLVLMTIGGNDLNFAQIVLACFAVRAPAEAFPYLPLPASSKAVGLRRWSLW